MKFLALIVIFVFVYTVSSAPFATEEPDVDELRKQLEERALNLESRIKEEIARLEKLLGSAHEITKLRIEEGVLRIISAELSIAFTHNVIIALEHRLKAVEDRVEEELNRLNPSTGSPPPRPSSELPPTGSPPPRPSSELPPTGSPPPRPSSELPQSRSPTGTPPPRPSSELPPTGSPPPRPSSELPLSRSPTGTPPPRPSTAFY